MSYTATLDSTNNLVSVLRTREHLGIDTGVKQVITVTCTNENADGGLGGKYFTFDTTEAQYYVWYDVDDGSVDPAVSGRTGVEIDISDGDSAGTVATATQVAITELSGVTATVSGSAVTIIDDTEGAVAAPDDGTTIFTVATVVDGTAGDSSHDDRITDLINGVSWFFNSMCDRKLKAQSLTEYYDGPGGYLLYLNNPPIASLALYQDSERSWASTSLIASTDYALYEQTGRLVLTGDAFLRDIRVVKAVYTGGFSTIPYDIEEAALELIAQRFHMADSKGEDKSSISNDGGTTAYLKDMSPFVSSVIARYRRWGAIGG